jgi:hypothetical protein
MKSIPSRINEADYTAKFAEHVALRLHFLALLGMQAIEFVETKLVTRANFLEKHVLQCVDKEELGRA